MSLIGHIVFGLLGDFFGSQGFFTMFGGFCFTTIGLENIFSMGDPENDSCRFYSFFPWDSSGGLRFWEKKSRIYYGCRNSSYILGQILVSFIL